MNARKIIQRQNRKASILSLVFGVVLLFALVLQSVDSIHHLEKSFTEKKCLHKASGHAQILHGHQQADHCFVCEFTFSNATAANFLSFQLYKAPTAVSYSFFHSGEITQFFKGSLFALRAPPFFIV